MKDLTEILLHQQKKLLLKEFNMKDILRETLNQLYNEFKTNKFICSFQ
jgi:hypothetical protein